MKKAMKKVCAIVLALGLMLTLTATALAATSYKGTSSAVQESYDFSQLEDTGYVEVTFTIPEGASGDLTIDFATTALNALDAYAATYGYASYPVQPGDFNGIHVTIVNHSGHEYAYRNNSLVVSTADLSKEENLTSFVGFDGQNIPQSFVSSRSANAAIVALCGRTASNRVTLEDYLTLSNTLATAGYSSLSAYYCDYYQVSAISELSTDQVYALTRGNVAIFTITAANRTALIEKYGTAYTDTVEETLRNDGKYQVQIRESEAELAALGYGMFYNNLFSIAFGADVDALNPNGAGVSFCRVHGIGDYMATGSTVYADANTYFNSLTPLNAANQTMSFSTKLAVDGPWTDNAYQNYDFSLYAAITLVQTDVEEEEIPDDDVPLSGPTKPDPTEPAEEIIDDSVPLSGPQTGDASHITLLIAGAVLSFTAGAALVIGSRKKNARSK